VVLRITIVATVVEVEREKKTPLLYICACQDVEGNFFLSFLLPFFLLCLSYFPTLRPVHPLTFQTQRPFLEVARRAALRRDVATSSPETFSLDLLAEQAKTQRAERYTHITLRYCKAVLTVRHILQYN